jgi:hypothetical protein
MSKSKKEAGVFGETVEGQDPDPGVSDAADLQPGTPETYLLIAKMNDGRWNVQISNHGWVIANFFVSRQDDAKAIGDSWSAEKQVNL